MGLRLPACKASTVIFYQQLKAGHARWAFHHMCGLDQGTAYEVYPFCNNILASDLPLRPKMCASPGPTLHELEVVMSHFAEKRVRAEPAAAVLAKPANDTHVLDLEEAEKVLPLPCRLVTCISPW